MMMVDKTRLCFRLCFVHDDGGEGLDVVAATSFQGFRLSTVNAAESNCWFVRVQDRCGLFPDWILSDARVVSNQTSLPYSTHQPLAPVAPRSKEVYQTQLIIIQKLVNRARIQWYGYFIAIVVHCSGWSVSMDLHVRCHEPCAYFGAGRPSATCCSFLPRSKSIFHF